MFQVTFFSYKGGSGRSTTLFNTIPFLAKQANATKDNPIVLFDMDYRSAGVTILCDKQDVFRCEPDEQIDFAKKRHSVQDVLNYSNVYIDCETIDDFRDKYAVAVGNLVGIEDNDAILLVGANLYLRNDEPNRVTAENKLSLFVEFLAEAGVSGIVYDSPSGTQISADVSIDKSNVTVCCLRPSYQFRETTFDYLNTFVRLYASSRYKRVILLPTAVPSNDFQIKDRYQITDAKIDISRRLQKLIVDCRALNPNRAVDIVDEAMITDDLFGIPEVERFKWYEKMCLHDLYYNNIDRLSDIEKIALSRYELLAMNIVKSGK